MFAFLPMNLEIKLNSESLIQNFRVKYEWCLLVVFWQGLLEGDSRMYGSVLEHLGIHGRMEELGHQYASLLEYNPDAILIFDTYGRLMFANAACERILGYSFDVLKEMRMLNLIQAAHHIRVLRGVANVLRGRPQNYETTVYQEDGRRVEISIKNVPMIVSGEVSGYFAILRDITEQNKSYRELRATKQLLESVFQQTSDAISVIDLDDNIMFINPAFETMFGWSADEILGKKLPIIPSESHSDLKLISEAASQGTQIIGMESIRMKKDGTRMNTSVSVSPIQNGRGEVIAVAGVLRDISERKRVEAALRDSEERYRLIAENMTDVIGTLDPDGTVTYAAPSSQSVLGFHPRTYIGQPIFDFVHDVDKGKLQCAFHTMNETQQPCRVNFRYRHADGHLGIMELHMTPVVLNGEVSNVVVVGREITERTKTEELLRKSEKLSALGQLAAGVAHEIRNPMTALRGFIQLLREKTNSHDDYFNIMLSELNRVEQIVSEFLMLSKNRVARVANYPLSSILNHVLSLLEAEAILRNVQLTFDCVGDMPVVACDEGQLKQVFVNVIKNGMEAMPNGGILEVNCLLTTPNHVAIRFQDYGVGIPEEQMHRLGEPFFTTKAEGTGLGLMVSHKIIEEHGGNMNISSEVGKGTVVEVLLPMSSREE